MDTVIHDGAPNVGGAWASEAYSQSWLVLESLKLACEFLAPRGTFVTKIFRYSFVPFVSIVSQKSSPADVTDSQAGLSVSGARRHFLHQCCQFELYLKGR